ncbi:hypothetical protein [Breznakiella homolactica]|uniref:DUF4345 domain-containing protein n=1 Tax=Breznakiella homolactica TaxID=2798577 RepID=A0A7T8BAR9_9SPIR|nr:hypothetical protein [Breznakiella homolactica]QQO08448.1 hypothetical protein JFL75_16145 [Breznakiella homolactica]
MRRLTVSYLGLQLSLALMFIALGISGITSYSSGTSEFMRGLNQIFGRGNNVIPIVMSVIELIAGFLLIISIFNVFPNPITSVLLLVIFIFWAVTIVLQYFFNGFLKPDFIRWLGNISPQLVVLSALWIVFRGVSRT